MANVNIEESELPSMKALGVRWNAETDMFTFKLNPPKNIEYTKQGLLKKLATLFDPPQMLAPFTVRVGMVLQETWLLGLGWDEEFHVELRKTCEEWFSQQLEFFGVQVPRCYREASKNIVDASIHTMTDPMQLAYAAKSCVPHVHGDGNVTVRFVAVKATRAVHLEMAFSLSTTDFLNAFSRMVTVRGRPEEVTSDNGSNLVGADRNLENLFSQKIKRILWMTVPTKE